MTKDEAIGVMEKEISKWKLVLKKTKDKIKNLQKLKDYLEKGE